MSRHDKTTLIAAAISVPLSSSFWSSHHRLGSRSPFLGGGGGLERLEMSSLSLSTKRVLYAMDPFLPSIFFLGVIVFFVVSPFFLLLLPLAISFIIITIINNRESVSEKVSERLLGTLGPLVSLFFISPIASSAVVRWCKDIHKDSPHTQS